MDNRLTYNELRDLATDFVEIISSKEREGKAVTRFKNIELILWLFIDWLWDKHEIQKKGSTYNEKK